MGTNTNPVEGLDPGKDAAYQVGASVLGAVVLAVPVLLVISVWAGSIAPLAVFWRWWPITLLVAVYLVLTLQSYVRYRRRYGAKPRRFRIETLTTENPPKHIVQWKPIEGIQEISKKWWVRTFYEVGDDLLEWIVDRIGSPEIPPVEKPPPFYPAAPPPEGTPGDGPGGAGTTMPGAVIIAQIALLVMFVLLLVLLVGSL